MGCYNHFYSFVYCYGINKLNIRTHSRHSHKHPWYADISDPVPSGILGLPHSLALRSEHRCAIRQFTETMWVIWATVTKGNQSPAGSRSYPTRNPLPCQVLVWLQTTRLMMSGLMTYYHWADGISMFFLVGMPSVAYVSLALIAPAALPVLCGMRNAFLHRKKVSIPANHWVVRKKNGSTKHRHWRRDASDSLAPHHRHVDEVSAADGCERHHPAVDRLHVLNNKIFFVEQWCKQVFKVIKYWRPTWYILNLWLNV